jgi:hypothetical protein
MARMGVRQRKREVQCAMQLVEMVAPYVRGDVDGFKRACTIEAMELVNVSFGACLLFVLAEIYQCVRLLAIIPRMPPLPSPPRPHNHAPALKLAEAMELVNVSFGACLLFVLADIYQCARPCAAVPRMPSFPPRRPRTLFVLAQVHERARHAHVDMVPPGCRRGRTHLKSIR